MLWEKFRNFDRLGGGATVRWKCRGELIIIGIGKIPSININCTESVSTRV